MNPVGTCDSCYSREKLAQLGDSDTWVCEECYPGYHKCECCEEVWDHEDMMIRNGHEKWTCQPCQDDQHTKCENCEELFPNDDVSEDDWDMSYCTSCKEEGHGRWKQKAFEEWADQEVDRRRSEY